MRTCKNKISVVTITKNEETSIGDCIAVCSQFSDDIIVIDSQSTDQTIQIAESAGAKAFVKVWEGYGNAKNYGASLVKYDWILCVDADERPDEEMISSLCEIDLNKNTIYGFNRLNYVGNVPVRHGDWNPDVKFRLYHKEVTSWSKNSVHENLMFERWHSRSVLPGTMKHYSYRNLNDLKLRLNHYAMLSAQEMHSNGESPGILSKIKPWFKFFRSYYLKGGFKDGKLGYAIAKHNAEAQRMKYNYLNKLLNN